MKKHDTAINAAFEKIVRSVDEFCAFEDADSQALQVVLYTALGAYKARNIQGFYQYVIPFLTTEVERVKKRKQTTLNSN